MRPDILIIGQGLAGTMLGWELERAGFSFTIAASDHTMAASRAGAGIINPVTGRRLVKSWRVETLLPIARDTYRSIEASLNVPLWQEMRVRRLFADERERQVFAVKRRTGDASLGPFAGEADEMGFWVEGAARVDLAVLLTATRAHWQRQGRLREAAVDPGVEASRHDLVIDCTGVSGARADGFGFVPWEFSKGEILEVTTEGLDPAVVINRRHWVLPVGKNDAWVGATHEPGMIDPRPSIAARETLEASARELLSRPFAISGQRAGIRVNLPDKRPVAGRHPERTALGIVNALGAKGTLLAPMLAQQWVNHLRHAAAFTPEIALERFFR